MKFCLNQRPFMTEQSTLVLKSLKNCSVIDTTGIYISIKSKIPPLFDGFRFLYGTINDNNVIIYKTKDGKHSFTLQIEVTIDTIVLNNNDKVKHNNSKSELYRNNGVLIMNENIKSKMNYQLLKVLLLCL